MTDDDKRKLDECHAMLQKLLYRTIPPSIDRMLDEMYDREELPEGSAYDDRDQT